MNIAIFYLKKILPILLRDRGVVVESHIYAYVIADRTGNQG